MFTFEAFVDAVMARHKYVGDLVYVRNDRDNGRYLAKLPNGVRIIGRPGSRKVTVRQDSHQWMAEF